MTENIIALIPARLDSNRLPKKQLREIGGEAMISYLATRMGSVSQIDKVVLATTDRSVDDPIVNWAKAKSIAYYRGDLEDVLGRLLEAGRRRNADIVVRANGDNPLLAPEATSAGLTAIQNNDYEYVTGKHMFTGMPIGIGPNILRIETLAYLDQVSDDPYQREHVTPYIFENLDEFEWSPIPVEERWIDRGRSLTVDTKEEFEFVKQVIEALPQRQPEEWSIEEIITMAKEIRS